MELATGAMGSLLPKLLKLLEEEYQLQRGVKKDIKFLESEMRGMGTALRKVARVPRDQLDEQVKIWADEVRELSYKMEDVVDSFLVRVEGSDPTVEPDTFKGFMKKVAKLFENCKARHQIADAIKDIKGQVQEVADRRDRYKVDDVHANPAATNTVRANPAATTTVDPRMLALFKDQRELVGIEGPRDELIKRLTDGGDGVSKQQLKILSIFGFGGLGKTTLARAVYDNLPVKFDCKAFVSVGQNPVKKVLMDILRHLDKDSYLNATILDERQLIEDLRGLLENKRYLIVVDDIWDIKSWEIIRCAWVDSHCGSIIITTTRILEVVEKSGHVYKHKPLSRDNSRELFYKRLSIGKAKYSFDHTVEMSEKILQKCGGVPLAIVTIASLLADKPSEDWSDVYNSIRFGLGDNIHVDNTRKILSYSYYDLPCYLRTCLLHLSIFPEDYKIKKDTLIWKWVGEGFVREEPGMSLFELGEKYFNELINRSMIQPVEDPDQGIIDACRVHDLVLDMIYSLSKEENFVVVLGSNKQHICPQSNARRIAVQNSVIDQHNPIVNTPMPQVRSFNVTMCRRSMMPSLSSFQSLRVLAIEDCTDMKDCCLEHLGKLLQLRYLGLFNTPISELPEEIGDLRFLQTLDLRETGIQELPRSLGQLRQLKCLRLEEGMISVSDWIRNLTSLEEASVDFVCPKSVKELGKLTELRVFKTTLRGNDADPELFKDMMDSLGNMQRLQSIDIVSWARDIDWTDCKGFVLPRHLRRLTLQGVVFPKLPAWIDSSHLPLLSHLELDVNVMKAKDVEILGKFLELLTLVVRISNNIFPDVIGGGAFPKLRYLIANAKLRFLQGAMPSLESVTSSVVWRALKAANLNSDFASIGNLLCLQKVKIVIDYTCKSDLEEAEAALRHAVKVHPNSPTLELECLAPRGITAYCLMTGAMSSLLPKLLELLKEKYQLQTGVKKAVKFLESEMRRMETALCKVARVPRDQLDEQVKIWADEVRELSYEMEDVVNSFLVRVEGSEPTVVPDSFKGFMKKVAKLFKKGKSLHQIGDAIKDIKDQVQEAAARHDRYKFDDVRANPASTTTVDPHMLALFKDQRELVGIEELVSYRECRVTQGSQESQNDQVPPRVWEMCGSLPLPIVTMAGVVASRPQTEHSEWSEVCNTLFPQQVCHKPDEFMRIINYYYNDLPSDVKIRSLYLSIFPKGCKISRKRLIRRWIAEGSVSAKQGLSVEDVAETCFNQLIEKKIIWAVERSSNGRVKSCQVHDMVLEYIISKAGEENFITVVGGEWSMPTGSKKVRRLSLHNSDSKSKHVEKVDTMNLSRIRSLTVFGSHLPCKLINTRVVQVLDLEGCRDFVSISDICEATLLKYLSLRGTDIRELPQNIRNLKYLETLDIRETQIQQLPVAICHLERIRNILGGDKKKGKTLRLPIMLNGAMRELRILSGVEISEGSSAASDIALLTRLTKLAIYKLHKDNQMFNDLLSSIQYLSGYALQTLVIHDESRHFLNTLDTMSAPPTYLSALELSGKLLRLPKWLPDLNDLVKLTLSASALRTHNLVILSKLQSLFSLTFSISATNKDPELAVILEENQFDSRGDIFVPVGGFGKLKLFRIFVPLLPSLNFYNKSTPLLERLELCFKRLEGLHGLDKLGNLHDVVLTVADKAIEFEPTKSRLEDLKKSSRKYALIVNEYHD